MRSRSFDQQELPPEPLQQKSKQPGRVTGLGERKRTACTIRSSILALFFEEPVNVLFNSLWAREYALQQFRRQASAAGRMGFSEKRHRTRALSTAPAACSRTLSEFTRSTKQLRGEMRILFTLQNALLTPPQYPPRVGRIPAFRVRQDRCQHGRLLPR